MSVNQVNRQPDYSDLDLDFFINPSTNDVTRKVGDEAIKRAVRNLILTNYNERPFQSYIGSDVRKILFEPMTSFTAIQLQKAIKLCIENFEPRVKLQAVDVTTDNDNNGFNIRLQYIILNRDLPVTTTIFLERIR